MTNWMKQTEQQQGLLPFYTGWEAYQNLLKDAIAPLTAEQLALRIAPQLRSVGENAAHIIATRVGWFHGLMGAGDPALAGTFDALDRWDLPGEPTRSADELVQGLDLTWQMIHTALTNWTSADLDYVFQGTRNGKEYRFTRGWVIWHVIEHDLHHGGEISFMLGAHNLAALDI